MVTFDITTFRTGHFDCMLKMRF